MPCRFCGVVNTLCYWGPRPIKSWKRPLLLVASVILTVGGLAGAWIVFEQGLVVAFLSSILAALGALGIAVSLFGCNKCVARLFADGI